ncbi:Hypothetical protein SMAX5B_014889 [Scophthalmus maximus]|uniref:Uncharacterized protein n=1 Tax=Scophthalmus maximus TaxID=52904 RepID=A0A2U9C2R6_SCOMX|nr:Hypothetical protein SMAX5B_014889 [Scophthalmus maximus]
MEESGEMQTMKWEEDGEGREEVSVRGRKGREGGKAWIDGGKEGIKKRERR